jgi:hypothetical protein
VRLEAEFTDEIDPVRMHLADAGEPVNGSIA